MPDARAGLGRSGEAVARRHLEAKGYAILAERFRTRAGEIDLVVEDGRTIVFVEVKTRRSRSAGAPEESVGPLKQRRLVRMASVFLTMRGLHGRDCRFDVVAVEERDDGPIEIRHLRDAFRA